MKRWPNVAALVCALALLLASCAEQKKTGFPEQKPTEKETGESPEPTGTGAVELTAPVEVLDNEFKPAQGSVKVGATVRWKQTGSAPHTVTADDESFDSHPDCTFSLSSKCMNSGDEYEQTFKEAGRFAYYCKLHGGPGGVFMAGVIVVVA